jgi:hypothetical protein
MESFCLIIDPSADRLNSSIRAIKTLVWGVESRGYTDYELKNRYTVLLVHVRNKFSDICISDQDNEWIYIQGNVEPRASSGKTEYSLQPDKILPSELFSQD